MYIHDMSRLFTQHMPLLSIVWTTQQADIDAAIWRCVKLSSNFNGTLYNDDICANYMMAINQLVKTIRRSPHNHIKSTSPFSFTTHDSFYYMVFRARLGLLDMCTPSSFFFLSLLYLICTLKSYNRPHPFLEIFFSIWRYMKSEYSN